MLVRAKLKPPASASQSARLSGHGPGRVAGLEHDRHAGHGQRQAQQRHQRGLFAQQRPGQHHGPGRHQVEQQHHPHHVAHGDGPVEADVGHAGRRRQQPQQRLAGEGPPGPRPDASSSSTDSRYTSAVATRGCRPCALQLAERPPGNAPDEGVEHQRQRRQQPCRAPAGRANHAGCRGGRSSAGARLLRGAARSCCGASAGSAT